jgi:hypothetical protein
MVVNIPRITFSDLDKILNNTDHIPSRIKQDPLCFSQNRKNKTKMRSMIQKRKRNLNHIVKLQKEEIPLATIKDTLDNNKKTIVPSNPVPNIEHSTAAHVHHFTELSKEGYTIHQKLEDHVRPDRKTHRRSRQMKSTRKRKRFS